MIWILEFLGHDANPRSCPSIHWLDPMLVKDGNRKQDAELARVPGACSLSKSQIDHRFKLWTFPVWGGFRINLTLPRQLNKFPALSRLPRLVCSVLLAFSICLWRVASNALCSEAGRCKRLLRSSARSCESWLLSVCSCFKALVLSEAKEGGGVSVAFELDQASMCDCGVGVVSDWDMSPCLSECFDGRGLLDLTHGGS